MHPRCGQVMLIGLRDRPDLELGVSQARIHTEVPVGTRRRKVELWLSSSMVWAVINHAHGRGGL